MIFYGVYVTVMLHFQLTLIAKTTTKFGAKHLEKFWYELMSGEQ